MCSSFSAMAPDRKPELIVVPDIAAAAVERFLALQPRTVAHGAVNLGDLKAIDGAFNYEVPPGLDVSQFQSAIVYRRRFSVLFAVAPLIEAR